MNRLQIWSHTQQTEAELGHTEEWSDALLPAVQPRVKHAVFAPLHYEPNYAYPLIVWLHGPRGNEKQLQQVMPRVSMRNYVGIGPRGGQDTYAGFTWNECDFGLAERSVFECVEIATTKFNVAADRVFLAGYDCGGTMALRVALKHPGAFAGVLSVGGPFPLGQMPLARLEQARQLRIFLAQGKFSQQYPVERSCDELRLFHSAGMRVTVRQYPCGDEVDSLMLHDMDVWMMELITGVSSCSEAAEPNTPYTHLN